MLDRIGDTFIPVSRLLEGEKLKLVHMEDRLPQRVVGQREAVEAVSNAVRALQKNVQDSLAKLILEGEFNEGDTVRVDADEKGLVFAKL